MTLLRGNGSERERFAAMVDETAASFRIDPRIYDDPAVFEAEMDRIFGRTWVYVGHESEVPAPGDYCTATIGLQPIVLSRGRDAQLRVFLNVCRHRGNVLCREAGGNSNAFNCRYHGWTFSNHGELVGVPGIEAYPERFRAEQSSLGLLQARVGVYQGLIFANLGDDGESLDDYLGAVKPFIDLWADLSPAGSVRLTPPHSYSYRGNWKFQVENGVDMYHPPFVHRSAFDAFRSLGLQRYQADQRRQNRELPLTFGFDRGHSVLQRPGLESIYTPEQLERYLAALTARHGPERARQIAMIRHVHVFPNLCLMDANIRVIQPLAVDATSVRSSFTKLGGVADDINAARLDDCQRRLGTTGLIATDDVDIFAGNQTGIRSKGLERLILDRGIDREVLHADGMREGGPTDETPQRAIYRGWRRAMSGAPERVPHGVA
jgi:phenylpropionate dioxygenase-like ring-hydroxylating dioxygenase large terminal subunit